MGEKNIIQKGVEKATEKAKATINHIQEYFDGQQGNKSSELFKIADEELDFKTDLNENEIKIITTLYYNDQFLISKGLKPIFKIYYEKYLRLRVSKDRLGRTEFVKMNTTEQTDEVLQRLGNASTIISSRK